MMLLFLLPQLLAIGLVFWTGISWWWLAAIMPFTLFVSLGLTVIAMVEFDGDYLE